MRRALSRWCWVASGALHVGGAGALVLVLAFAGACAAPNEEGDPLDEGKADAWDDLNDPRRFRAPFIHTLRKLPKDVLLRRQS